MMMRKCLAALLAAFVVGGPAAAQQKPVRLVLIVGDGTGLTHWSAARLSADSPLAVDRLPVIGLMDTRCICSRTTDSGAAATAFATGRRTRYRMVGTGPDSTPLTSVLEVAEARGLATGLVTTSYITDATPAAFGADRVTRYDREGIATDYAAKDIEVLLGGGRYWFTHRADGRDLLAELKPRYATATTPAEFEAAVAAGPARLLGLFADSTIFPHNARRPTLPRMASVALSILDRDPDGFFLLLESEDTDELGHQNRPLPELVAGMRELDATIAVALEYQRRRPETLVVVLGDHETGGLALQVARDTLTATYASTDHTAEPTPIFAGGPGAERFGRWLGNDEVGRLLLEFVGQAGPRK